MEQELAAQTRELARAAVEFAYNQLEADEPRALPPHVQHEAGPYRRLNHKTPNRGVATLFGKITLWRHGYRYVQRDVAEPTIFPLEISLGLVGGATPALASAAAKGLAEAGATQEVVLARLRTQHGVEWGVKKLRAVAENLSAGMDRFRREHQAKQAVDWLRQAYASSGKHRPALVLGRDGITLCTRPHSFFEVATTATLSIYDRRGQRLGTVYLAYAPELGQQTMTDELTALLLEVLRQWAGPLPRLAYLTDAGAHETQYPRKVLKKLRHPQTGKRLTWQWIVDYYHASQRLTTMAEALFGVGREASAWAAKMRKLLKKPNGPFRVLHSAAALRDRHRMSAAAKKEFRKAYRYLRDRTRHMRYAEFRAQGLPIGSGITEAACKTVFTQRLKLSGMRWSNEGAQLILNLRVILLSGVWDEVYRDLVNSYQAAPPRTLALSNAHRPRKAA
ncbi:MAG: hypothetical protein HYX68_09910 [Planctomycetes bacterium]|nr:hypothetical protein [Planctomycetota bacterium]